MGNIYAVLGSNGNIGRLIVSELNRLKLIVHPVDRQQADLLNPGQTLDALKGVSHAFVTTGLPYSTAIWESQWPIIMRNIIDGAAKTGCKIIFFDNIYMYGPAPLDVPITESHPQHPPSAMGRVRKQIADMLMSAHKAGMVQAVIARSADFYGPSATNGVLNMNVIDRMVSGKKPRWLGDPHAKHSFSYAPDAARATVMLGLDDKSYGQVWHLPVAAPAMTVQEIVGLINRQLGTKLPISLPSRSMLSIVGFFNPIVGEAARMSYQFDHDYILSCDKFMKAHPGFAVTSYQDGLLATLESRRTA